MTAVNRQEALRYLGYRKDQEVDPATCELLEEGIAELEKTAAPRWVYDIREMTGTDQGIRLCGKEITSRRLAKHLTGCRQVVVFAATLGAEVDRLIGRYNRLQMSRAVVLQAAAAAMIEAYCDECQHILERQAAEKGMYVRSRFSPGYGDFAITHQVDILSWLHTEKKIGLTMTDSYMLVPSKSVTALLGLTEEAGSCHTVKCLSCETVDCPFRRTET